MFGWKSRWKVEQWLEAQMGQGNQEECSRAPSGPQLTLRRWEEPPTLALHMPGGLAPHHEEAGAPFLSPLESFLGE